MIHQIQFLEWQKVSLFGQIAKRQVVHFGLNYDYGSRQVTPTVQPPGFLDKMIERSAQLIHKPSESIVEVLITKYPAGAGINWHRDAPVFQDIVGLSLSSDCIIHFRNRADKTKHLKLVLEPRSAYVLTNSVRWDWEHRIAAVKTLRYSLTFRTLKKY